jgi:F-type H+-transporting ATPase subunit a
MEGIHITLAADTLGEFLGIPITNSLLTTWLVVGLLALTAFFLRRNLQLIPGKIQGAFEAIVEVIYDYIAETLESRELARRYFPLIATIFLFILTANLITFVPGIESIVFDSHGHEVPLLRPVNTDLNIPLALAMISFLVIELSGIFALGILKYGGKFVNFRSPMDFAVGALELIGNLARLLSLSFRLFGNILAGHVLIIVVIFFAPLFMPLPFMLFEVFVGFMQAAIFALLTLFFVKLAVSEPHGDH